MPRRRLIDDIRLLASTGLTPTAIEERRTAVWHRRPDDLRDHLLTTKHAIPSLRAPTLARPRLTDRLDQGLGRKLTLVAAPAGYGKTSLLSAWAQHHTNMLGWLNLDRADNDLQHFWTYVIGALDALRSGLSTHAFAHLRNAPAAPIEAALTALLNALADQPDRLILVLDDYHTITTPAIHQAMTFLLEYLPPQLHLVLVARTSPPLPIARLRARDELNELGVADLRFTQEEAAVLLQQIMGLDLTTEDVADMTTRTEGWITGLYLAGLDRQREPEPSASSMSVRRSDRYLYDYLIEEVLKQQPPEIQTFLLQTAILERLNADLCDTVLAIENEASIIEQQNIDSDHTQSSMFNAQSILEELERANLFIVPLDDERHWYRYHPLFGEALRAYLQLTYPSRVPDLQRRAAAWYAQHRMTPADPALPDRAVQPTKRAVRHALETATHRLIEPLSPRELEVLRLVTQGLPNRAVAAALIIGIGTVKTHLLSIYAKLGVHSRTEAVVCAQALGLV